jgi:tetratricopeptide (TPR) repeat protein
MNMKAIAFAAAAALWVQPASAEWRAYETPHFIVYSESATPKVDELATRLETYDKLMRMATGTQEDDPVKVRIYEVEDMDAVEKAIGEYDSGVAGFYNSNSLGPFLVTPRKTSRSIRYFTPELVMQHEYAHHFMLQYFPTAYPSWYVEGFAELIGSSMPMPDGRIGYGMPAKHRGNQILNDWVPLQELLTKEKVVYLDTYGQGWALTHFLAFDTERSKQLRAYLTALREGKNRAEAAKVFGDLGDLNTQARRYVGGGSFEYRPVKVEIRHPVLKRSRTLSPGEAALIPEVIAFRDEDLSAIRSSSVRSREERLRRQNLERIREVVARYPNDPAALYLLAVAERTSGNRNEALAAANRVLARQPNHAGGMVEKSLALSGMAASLSGAQKDAATKEARALREQGESRRSAAAPCLLPELQSDRRAANRRGSSRADEGCGPASGRHLGAAVAGGPVRRESELGGRNCCSSADRQFTARFAVADRRQGADGAAAGLPRRHVSSLRKEHILIAFPMR